MANVIKSRSSIKNDNPYSYSYIDINKLIKENAHSVGEHYIIINEDVIECVVCGKFSPYITDAGSNVERVTKMYAVNNFFDECPEKQ